MNWKSWQTYLLTHGVWGRRGVDRLESNPMWQRETQNGDVQHWILFFPPQRLFVSKCYSPVLSPSLPVSASSFFSFPPLLFRVLVSGYSLPLRDCLTLFLSLSLPSPIDHSHSLGVPLSPSLALGRVRKWGNMNTHADPSAINPTLNLTDIRTFDYHYLAI